MASKKNKIDERIKPKSFFKRFGLYSLIIPVLVAGIIGTWLYQTSNIVWSIGSETITKEEVELELKRLKPPDYEQKMKAITDPKDRQDAEDALHSKAMENLLKLKCLYLYAKENKIEATEKDTNAVIESFKKNIEGSDQKDFNLREFLADHRISWRTFLKDMKSQAVYNKVLEPVKKEITISEEELKSQYNKASSYYDVPATAHVMLIAIATEEEAKDIVKKLESGSDFMQLAREKSLAPDAAKNGGDIGWQAKENLLQEIGENVFHPTIEFNVPYHIQARDGWYVFVVKGKKPAIKRTFETAKDLVRNDVQFLKESQAIDGFMIRLTEKYEMQVKQGNPLEKLLNWWDKQRGKIK